MKNTSIWQNPKPKIHSLPDRGKGHSGTETRPIRICGSSEEYLTMGESLIMHFCVRYGIIQIPPDRGKANCRNPFFFLGPLREHVSVLTKHFWRPAETNAARTRTHRDHLLRFECALRKFCIINQKTHEKESSTSAEAFSLKCG